MKYNSRRDFLGKLIALPVGLLLTNYYDSLASARRLVMITTL